MMADSIYAYIKDEEAAFQTEQIQVGDNWSWNLRNHVQLIFHLKHGQFFTGENNWLRAFKLIMKPMIDLANWTEDIEVKDVTFFIEGDQGRVLSFLVKKYHDEVFVRKNDLDTLFSELTEMDNTYGGILTQKTATGRPELVSFNTVAFADQTDLLGSPIGFKINFSPEKLRSMSKLGWGNKERGATTTIEDLITIARSEKDADGTIGKRTNQTPGKQIEVYIVKGTLPQGWLKPGSADVSEKYVAQVQVVAFYTAKDKTKTGVTLYAQPDNGKTLKFFTAEPVNGRALGWSVAEALLHTQIWTNFLEIHKMQMLQAAAKVPLVTDDPSFTNKNKVLEMENLEITTIEEGKTITQIPTAATANLQLYGNAINDWYSHAQLVASAFDPLLGAEASSGTTFRGQERTVAQGRGSHDRRRGQRAKFIEQLYRDWIIPYIVREITSDQEFLATLSMEEMQWVVDQMTTNYVNRRIIDGMLKGKLMTPSERDLASTLFRTSFLKGGNKKLVKILAKDFKGIEIRMGINVAGKQKDLVGLSDKLLSVFQFVFANPAGFQQAMQIPALAKAFSDLLEFSGLDQADFASLLAVPQPQAAPQGAPQAPGQPAQPGAAQPGFGDHAQTALITGTNPAFTTSTIQQ